MAEHRLFEPETIPEYTTPEWYADREHAPHLEQEGHRQRLFKTASFVAQATLGQSEPSVVDLGSGDGGMLSLLGPSIPRWGYDLQPSNLLVGKQRGVDIRYGDVINDSIEWGLVAVATEMLEHLVDPHAFVRTIAQHSTFLVASSPWTEDYQNHYEFHTWAWDLPGYAALIEQAGYRVVRHERVSMFQVLLAKLR